MPHSHDSTKLEETGAEDRNDSDGGGNSGQCPPSQTLTRECPEDTLGDVEEVKRARQSLRIKRKRDS